MRPIHLAGGRQRDLYGPVISHRSSICIFMALSSSWKGGEAVGRNGRNRSSGRGEKGGGLPTLPKSTIPARWGFSPWFPWNSQFPFSSSGCLGGRRLGEEWSWDPCESINRYLPRTKQCQALCQMLWGAREDRLARKDILWSLQTPHPAHTEFLLALSFTSSEAKSPQFCYHQTVVAAVCCDNLDPSPVSITIPNEIWRKGAWGS